LAEEARVQTKGRILIVDDSALILDKAKTVLAGAGYAVTTTSQTVGVSSLLRDIDLAIIDFHMPGFDGKHVMQSIRNATKDGKLHFLAYLYTSDDSAAQTFKTLGFDGYFAGKGDPHALVTQVSAAFRRLQLRALTHGFKPE
jgi:DNA-binding response OmpR family regulator